MTDHSDLKSKNGWVLDGFLFVGDRRLFSVGILSLTLFQLFRGGCPDFSYRDVEVQGNACQGMVAVHCDLFILNSDDCDNHRTVIGIDSELHSNLKLFDSLELVARTNLLERIIPLAISSTA